MRRDQLEHAIRTACQISDRRDVIIVGSQAILGTYDETQLPAAATMSIEVDILPIADTNEETARLADLIEGVAGELSPFEELHGFSIDGADLNTAVLPAGWRNRLVKVHNANTAAAGEPKFTGWCLDKEDLCVAKPAAFREKDRNFVLALLQAELVDAELIVSRLPPSKEIDATQSTEESPGYARGSTADLPATPSCVGRPLIPRCPRLALQSRRNTAAAPSRRTHPSRRPRRDPKDSVPGETAITTSKPGTSTLRRRPEHSRGSTSARTPSATPRTTLKATRSPRDSAGQQLFALRLAM